MLQPKKNSKWQHTSGKIYRVLLLTNLSATKEDYPVTVVYEDPNGDIWSRPLTNWHSSMTEVK